MKEYHPDFAVDFLIKKKDRTLAFKVENILWVDAEFAEQQIDVMCGEYNED